MVASAGHHDVAESSGREQPGQRAPGEHAQVPGDLAARPAVHAAEADLREHGLDAQREQPAVVPGREVRRGQQQRAARLEHPARLVERRIGVDQVLDELAHDHDVGGTRAHRQAGRLDGRTHQAQSEPPGAGQAFPRPVETSHPVPGTGPHRLGHRRAVTAADVQDISLAWHIPQHRSEHPRLPPGPVRARTQRNVLALIERDGHPRTLAIASSAVWAKPSTASAQCSRSARSRAARPIASLLS